LDHSQILTVNGLPCQPESVDIFTHTWTVDTIRPKIRSVLSRNLQALIDSTPGDSQSALHRRSKVAQATIGRIVSDEGENAGIETVEKLARAYGLYAWQLLIPGMEPGNPPVLKVASEDEKALYERLHSAIEAVRKLQQ
jgi:hypothetical protein